MSRSNRPPTRPLWALGHRLHVAVCTAVLSIVGCASLDPTPDQRRMAAAVEHAVGTSPDWLESAAAPVEATTRALLADGLTDEEAVQVALLNQPAVRVALASIGVSRAAFVQSTLYTNPTLFLSFRLPDGGGNPNVEINLAQNIAELWLVPARSAAAQRDLDRTVLDAAQITAAVVLEVRDAFIWAVQAGRLVTLAEDRARITAELVQQAQQRQAAGVGSEVDHNLAQATHLQAQAALRTARREEVERKALLCRQLGLLDDPADLQLRAAARRPHALLQTTEELQQIAQAARLDLQSLDATVAQTAALADLERVRFLRAVDVGFAFELIERRKRGDRNFLGETFYESLQSGALTPPSLAPRGEQGVDTIFGPTLTLELPLWDQNLARIAIADGQLEQARQRRDARRVVVAQDIHIALARLRAAVENAALYREQIIPTAQRNVELTRQGYQAGSVSFLSVLEAQRAYLVARGDQIGTQQDAARAEVLLERATGRPIRALHAVEPTP